MDMTGGALLERWASPSGAGLGGVGTWPYVLGSALTAVAAAGAGLTFLVAGILRGPAVMQGSARGTALVMLVLAVPALLVAMWATGHGSDRAVLVWLGATAYLTYNSVMLVFGTPFNKLFLLYVATLGLGIATLISLLGRLDVAHLAARLAPTPTRFVAGYLAFVTLANAVIWLRVVLRDLASDWPPEHLKGTGLTTNPIYVQDLAFWLPLAGLAAALLWQHLPWGYVLSAGIVCMWFIEAVGVAADQWYGSHADPGSTVASMAGAYLFVGVAVATLVPMVLLLGRLAPDAG
jgi:hypothetical protein